MRAAEVRAFLERHGLAPRAELGQCFLIDPALAERMVARAGVEPGDAVIEIGAGTGSLTRPLAARAARVLVLEVDAGLVRALRAERLLPDNVELQHADALRFDWAAAARRLGSPLRVVANLPYSISGPLLRRLLDLRGRVRSSSVMLQREVAARLLAAPGSRDYGSLSVLHQLSFHVERSFELAPSSFWPQPQVRSSVLRMTPREGAPVSDAELGRLEEVVRRAFTQRRKTLANALRAGTHAGEAAALSQTLERCGIDARARPESLAPERWRALSRALAEAAG